MSSASEIVFRELLRRSADCSEVGEIVRRLRNCTADAQLEQLVGEVLNIVDSINAGCAPASEGLALVLPGDGPAMHVHQRCKPGHDTRTLSTTMTIDGVARPCSHAQCPHISACIGAGDCTEPAMTIASGTNHVDLPAFLPLRNQFEVSRDKPPTETATAPRREDDGAGTVV